MGGDHAGLQKTSAVPVAVAEMAPDRSSGVLVDQRWRGDLRVAGGMDIQLRRVRCGEEFLRAFDFGGRAARHDEEAVGLQVGLVWSTLSFGMPMP